MRWFDAVENPRTRPWRAWVLDGVVVVVVVLVALPYLVRHAPDPRWVSALGTALMILPLWARRVWPVPVFVAVVCVAVGFGLWDLRLAGTLALPVALFSVAAFGTRRQAYACAAVLEVLALGGAVWLSGAEALAAVVLFTGMVAAALGLGLYQATRRAYVRELVDRTDQLERERDQTNELAAAAERARIAREMHDIVAHHLTVMVALSDGAARLAPTDPDAAAEAMRAVSATGRDALRDTRGLLGVLGEDTAPHADASAPATSGPERPRPVDARPTAAGPDRHPLPGLADLDTLVDQVRSTGLEVELRIAGAPASISADVQLALYRLVQESLTNSLKHAVDSTHAEVIIGYAPDAVSLSICDDGAGGTAPGARRPGRGLTGMRARIEAVGGTLSSGPATPRGWRVEARIPLHANAADLGVAVAG